MLTDIAVAGIAGINWCGDNHVLHPFGIQTTCRKRK